MPATCAHGQATSKGLGFSLVAQLAFYGAYHNNKYNQIIHFFFVPTITWSVFIWAASVSLAEEGSQKEVLPFLPSAVLE